MGVIVFHEGSGVPLVIGNKLIAQARDVLDVDAAHEGGRRGHGTVGRVVGGVTVKVDIGFVEREEMLVADAISEVGHSRERLSRKFSERGGTLTLRCLGYPLSCPAVGAAERVDVIGYSVVVTGRKAQVEPSRKEVTLLVEQARRECPVLAQLAAEDYLHQIGILHLSIFMSIA